MADDLRPEMDRRPAWSTREIARRNRAGAGKRLSPVMQAAATARELAHRTAAREARAGNSKS